MAYEQRAQLVTCLSAEQSQLAHVARELSVQICLLWVPKQSHASFGAYSVDETRH